MQRNTNSRKSILGLTLIEVTLVVALLLGLISVTFIGVKTYKEGADRAKCLVTSASVQKAMRSYQNMYELEEGDSLLDSSLIGPGKMFEVKPECPRYGGYVWNMVVPGIGTPYIDCADPDNSSDYH